MEKHDTIFVLLGGEAVPSPWLTDMAKSALIIAADGGITHAEALGIKPHLWVGDFDSTNGATAQKYTEVPTENYPAEKDISDGELAIEKALALDPKKIVLYGALGGSRIDHTFFVMLGALRKAQENPETGFILAGQGNFALPILPGKKLTIDKNLGTKLSIVPFSDLTSLSISGVHWPLDKAQIEMGSTHTLSNLILSNAIIDLKDGHAIAIVHDKN